MHIERYLKRSYCWREKTLKNHYWSILTVETKKTCTLLACCSIIHVRYERFNNRFDTVLLAH